jgi:hypothetical protein
MKQLSFRGYKFVPKSVQTCLHETTFCLHKSICADKTARCEKVFARNSKIRARFFENAERATKKQRIRNVFAARFEVHGTVQAVQSVLSTNKERPKADAYCS